VSEQSQNGNGHINFDKKKKDSSTPSLNRGTFISPFLVIVPSITEGEILGFVKRQTMGPAVSTVDGKKLPISLLEVNNGPFSLDRLVHNSHVF
jgi:hypothetical protein